MSEEDPAYQRITDAIARRAGSDRAPADFDDRLWAAIDAGQPTSRRRWLAASAAVAVAAAVALAFWATRERDQTDVERFAVLIERGDEVRRGDDAQPGDRAAISARADRNQVELRVYRDDRVLITACTDQPPCRKSGGAVRATVTLETAGVYQLVVLRGDRPPPPATGDFDADTAAAIEAGFVADTRRIEVR